MKGSIAHKMVAGKMRYYIVVDLPHLKGEKRKQKWVPVGTSYRQAEAALPKVLLEIQSQNHINSQNVYFRDVADDYLFANQNRLASSTYKRYAGIIVELKKYFGNFIMREIEPYHVEQYTRQLIKKGLSTSTISKYRIVLNLICSYALELKIIQTIPIAKFKQAHHSNFSFHVWTAEQADDFLQHIKGTPLYMPVFIAIHTGMRLGEILALQWSEIDLKNNQLTVRYSIDTNGDLKTTKTKASRRTIKLIPSVVEGLRKHKHNQRVNKIHHGPSYVKNNFVCTFEDGTPLTRNYVSITFRRKVKQYKFPTIRFHDLRHSFATIALTHNIHTKVVQEILGHSSSRTTLDVYSHVIPTMQEASLHQLTEAFEK